jgi:hypothetical protein
VAEVLIEGHRLDVKEGLDFSFNYSIADVRDPNKRNTNYSKTIKCPSTKNNDILFGNIWDVNIANPYDSSLTNIETNFNPNKKAEARVISDGVEVMAGVVQLRSITIVDGKFDYEVVFIGKLKNIFSELGDKQLNDIDDDGNPYIDFSDLDHDLTYTNISNSWSNTTGYVYPMIDYGIRFEYENNGERIYDVETWRPAVYLKDIVDRIFNFAGFTYESTFLSSAPFTKLIVPFHAESFTLTDTQIAERQFIAESDVAQSLMSGTTQIQIGNVDYDMLQLEYADYSDPNNIWDVSANEYTCNAYGYYSITVNAEFFVTRTSSTPPILTGVAPYALRIMRRRNSVETVVDGVQFDIDLPDSTALGATATTTLNWSSEQEIFEIGDEVWAELLIDSVSYASLPARFSIDHVIGGRISNQVTEETIFEGANVYMNNFAPELKMEDILLGVFKMFNLYVTVDTLNETNLIIETRDEYYGGGTIRDWSKKLARNKTVKITPLALLTGKEYIYTYESDDDYYNTRYEEARGQVYGTRRIEIDNDFLNNTTKVEVPFSATPLVNDGNTSRIIPKIYNEDIDEGGKPTDINMRILYYDGVISCAPNWRFRYDNESSVVVKATYPYAGHWDNPITPSLDLNFGLPKTLFYNSNGYTGTLQVTTANLFNVYHRAHIDEITDKDAKVLLAEFYLTPWDIEKLDFRDQILIDNSYWRINKISDYNPFKEGLTKVELFKVLEVVPQESEVFTLGESGSTGTGGTKEDKPYDWGRSKSNFNMFPVGKGSVNGKKNKISEDANNFNIIGDENYVGSGSSKVSITGNRNQVLFGASNVVIINSDDQVVVEDNVIIQGGHKMPNCRIQCASLTIASADVLQLNSTPLTIVSAPGSGYAIEVISASVKIDFNTTAYATEEAIYIQTSGANSPQAKCSFLDATLTRSSRFENSFVSSSTDTQLISNADLEVTCPNSPTTGDSDIEILVLYRIISV